MRRTRPKKRNQESIWRCPGKIRIRPFDMVRWVGDPAHGIPPPYTETQLVMMLAGSSALILAIGTPRKSDMGDEYQNNIIFNRRRFHKKPYKTKWEGTYG